MVGSALGVFPAAAIVPHARRTDARVIIVNLEPTPFDGMADVAILGKAGETLPELARRIPTGL